MEYNKLICVAAFIVERTFGDDLIIKKYDIAEEVYLAPHSYKIRFNGAFCWVPRHYMMPLSEFRKQKIKKLLR